MTNIDVAYRVIAADVDHDLDLDVLASSLEDDLIFIAQNTGGGSFQGRRSVATTIGVPWAIAASDFDGDQDLDLLTACGSGSNGEPSEIAWYFFNSGGGFFGNKQVIGTTPIPDEQMRSVCVADLDDDGDQDILTTRFSDDSVVWYQNLSPPPPALQVSNLLSGATATIDASHCFPGGKVIIGYSLAGGGPVSTPYGDLLLSLPYVLRPALTASSLGSASLDVRIPPGTSSTMVWLHALDVATGRLSNGLAEIIG